MAIQSIKVFPTIHSITIDKESEKVTGIVQDILDAQGIRKNLEESVNMVQKYNERGFYPLTKPKFIEDVMGSFAQMGLTREATISENTYHEIIGYVGCTRVWELPIILRDQVEFSLTGYDVDYDDESWEILKVEQIQN